MLSLLQASQKGNISNSPNPITPLSSSSTSSAPVSSQLSSADNYSPWPEQSVPGGSRSGPSAKPGLTLFLRNVICCEYCRIIFKNATRFLVAPTFQLQSDPDGPPVGCVFRLSANLAADHPPMNFSPC
eukprot:g8260.t1